MVSNVTVKKYRLFQNKYFQLPFLVNSFGNDLIDTVRVGVILKVGLCSDGCSPKYQTRFGLFGAWDGPKILIDKRYYLPITYDAFMLHDALLAHKKELGITAHQCHLAFDLELRKTGWWLAPLYIKMVYKFGPKD